MASLQTALRSAGLSSAPDAPEQPKIHVRQPVAVLKRELLWDTGVIAIKIPNNARTMNLETAGSNLCYLQFPQLVKGGVVNMHVHADEPESYIGKKIVAEAQVFRKEHADGRSFLYVDLRPVAADTPVTHRMAVMQMVPGVTSLAREAIVFETPAPLQGAVVIVDHDQKFV